MRLWHLQLLIVAVISAVLLAFYQVAKPPKEVLDQCEQQSDATGRGICDEWGDVRRQKE